jgi:glycosyltransferase involved in cell wall biosynthesis
MSIAISAVVNTLDAERFLAYALRSVAPWVAEIVVVDMESTDATVAVAERFGARVVPHPRTGFVEAARAFACAQARGTWLLVLDADEIVPPALARRLRAVAAGDEADVVRIARVNHLLGGALLHSGWNPERDRHTRFFKRGMVEHPAALHAGPRPVAGARTMTLAPEEALVHFNYVDVDEFLGRLNRYTGVEAAQAFARGTRASRRAALAGAAREWLTRYVRHRGYRDGWRGFYLSLMMALSPIVTQAKLAELEAAGPRDATVRRYRDSAEEVLAGYEGWR